MKLARHIGKWCLAAVIALTLLITISIGLAEPRSGLGHCLFHFGYLFPPTRGCFLSFYQWTLQIGEGGYLQGSIDTFLIDRLWKCENKKEFDAIIDFQIKQRSGRWGWSASKAHETLRQKIVDSVMGRLDQMPPEQAISAMIFVESLRRGTPLVKGGFSGMYKWNEDRTKLVLIESDFLMAKACFERWWTQDPSWPDKLGVDPLKNSNLRIHEGP